MINHKPLTVIKVEVSNQRSNCKRGSGMVERMGVLDNDMQTIIYRMDKQQGPAV